MKRIHWIIILVVIAAAAVWLWYSGKNPVEQPATEGLPQLPEVSEGDTTIQIQQDLEKIDLGDIDKEFKNIDAELNNL